MGHLINAADHYRLRAKDLREMAGHDPNFDALLKIADQYDRVAKLCEALEESRDNLPN